MKISILCTSPEHPVNSWLERWIKANSADHDIRLLTSTQTLPGGDLLLLVSCTQIVRREDREKYLKCLVLHASDLPQGRGWSPHVWQILGGSDQVTVSLLEAEEPVDSGDIWHKVMVEIPPHYLHDEINSAIFDAELALMDFALANFDTVVPQKQPSDIEASWYPKRSPEDSRLDPARSIEAQFNLIRVCDPDRFPAFFVLDGHKYKVTVEKI